MKKVIILVIASMVVIFTDFSSGIAKTNNLAHDVNKKVSQKTVNRPNPADNTVVRLITQLGVKKEIPINKIISNDLVVNHLIGPWNIDEANFVLETEKRVYLVIPQELFRTAEINKGVHIVKLSNGKQFEGKMVGVIYEGETATLMTNETNTYPLPDCVKIELVSIDKAYLKYNTERNSEKSDVLKKGTKWRLIFREKDQVTFEVSNPKLSYKYYSTAGYLIGGEDTVKETKSFQVQVAGMKHLVNIDDFIKIAFAKNQNGIETVSLESNTGVKSSGTVDIQESNRGDLFLVGELIHDPGMKVAINLSKWELRRE